MPAAEQEEKTASEKKEEKAEAEAEEEEEEEEQEGSRSKGQQQEGCSPGGPPAALEGEEGAQEGTRATANFVMDPSDTGKGQWHNSLLATGTRRHQPGHPCPSTSTSFHYRLVSHPFPKSKK